jgi:hypothetical protein
MYNGDTGLCYPLLDIDRSSSRLSEDEQTCSDKRMRYVASNSDIGKFLHKEHQLCGGQCHKTNPRNIFSNNAIDHMKQNQLWFAMFDIDAQHDVEYIRHNNNIIHSKYNILSCFSNEPNKPKFSKKMMDIYLICEESKNAIAFARR